MSKLTWDQASERLYETGVEQVALYVNNGAGYETGVAWNGCTALNLTPSGAEPTNLYANDKKYLALVSAEEMGGTIEAYTFPTEFNACNGVSELAPGVYAGQQSRKTFALVAKTLIGNDTNSNKHGYKLHILYGCLASPSEQAYATVNDSPEAVTFSWEFTTTPVSVTKVSGVESTAYICINSTEVDGTKLAALEAALYGGESAEPTLKTPDEIYEMLKTA